MPHQLMRPEALLLVIGVLWGIAGKLDEPIEGFDPEPASAHAPALLEEQAVPPLHLLCFLDDAGDDVAKPSPMPVLTSLRPAWHLPASHRAVPVQRLYCVLADEQEIP